MRKIPGIYVAIKGDFSELSTALTQARQKVTEQARGMSNALNNALSPDQIKGGVNQIIASLGQLSRASKLTGDEFSNIAVDLGKLQSVTGVTADQFEKLQQKMLQTTAAKAQSTALKGIATSAGLARNEIRELGTQFGLSTQQIEKVVVAIHGAEKQVQSLAQRIASIPAPKLFTSLADSSLGNLTTQAEAQVQKFAKTLLSISDGSKVVSKSFDLLQADMDSLTRKTGLTAEQLQLLKNRISSSAGEELKLTSFAKLAESANLSRAEIAKFGAQMGISAKDVELLQKSLLGALPPLKSLTLLSAEARQAFSGTITSSFKGLASDLTALASGESIAKQAMSALSVDLKELGAHARLTEKEFATLQSRFLGNQITAAQEKALESLSRAFKFSRTEIKQFGEQFGLTEAQIQKVTTAIHGAEKEVQTLAQRLASLPPLPKYTTLASSATTGLSGQAQSGVKDFSTNLVEAATAMREINKASNLAQIDLEALAAKSGLAAEQIQILKTRITALSGERIQTDAFQRLAESAGLSAIEIEKLGTQFGLSQKQIQKVTTAIHGAEVEFKALSEIIKSLPPLPNYTKLVDSSFASLTAEVNAQVQSFAKNLTALAKGEEIAGKGFKLLAIDMEALQKATGLTVEQLSVLESKMASAAGENMQVNALKELAAAARLSRTEIAELGAQMGVSASNITSIQNAIHGTLPELKALVTLSSEAQASLAGLTTSSFKTFASDLTALTQGGTLAQNAFKGLEGDLKELRSNVGLTEAEFSKLEAKLMQTQGLARQEAALKSLATSAGLTVSEMRALGTQLGVAPGVISKVATEMDQLGKATQFSLTKFKDMIVTVGLYTVAFMAFSEAISFVKKTIFDFNATLETAQIGMSASLLTAGKYVEEQNGRVLQGVEAFKAAQVDAKQIMEELKAANMSTIATLDQLVRAYQETLPNAMKAGFDKSQTLQFTTGMLQAAGAIDPSGALMHQMGEETRSLLTGNISERNSRIAVVLGITPDDIKKVKGNADDLFNFLMDKLSAYRAAGEELQNSWKGVTSNFMDIITQAGAMAGEPIFETVKAELKEIVDSMGTIDEKTHQMRWSDEFLSGVKDVKDGITAIIAEFYRFGMLVDKVGGTLTSIGSFLTWGDWDTAFNEWNAMYQKRYEEGDRHLQELANRSIGLNSDGTPKKTENNGINYKQNPPPPEKTKSHASDINAAARAEREYRQAQEESLLAVTKGRLDAEAQLNEEAYALGNRSYKTYLDEKHRLSEEELQATVDTSKAKLREAEEAAAKLKPIVDSKGNARPEKDDAERYAALKKIEDATKSVTIAENKLNEAKAKGKLESTEADDAELRHLQDLNIQLLELEGHYAEAAKAREAYEKSSVEYKRINAAAEEGDTVAQKTKDTLDAIRKHNTEMQALDKAYTSTDATRALAELNGERTKALDAEIALKDIELAKADRTGASAAEVQLLKQQREELVKMKQPLTAFGKGWEDVVKAQKTASEQMYELAGTLAKDLQSTFSNVFFDVMKGNFKDIASDFKDMGKRMLDTFIRMLADMAAAWAASKLFSMISGVTFNFGSGMSIGGSATGAVTSSVVGKAGSAALNYVTGGALGTPWAAEAAAGTTAATGAATGAAGAATGAGAGAATTALGGGAAATYAVYESGIAELSTQTIAANYALESALEESAQLGAQQIAADYALETATQEAAQLGAQQIAADYALEAATEEAATTALATEAAPAAAEASGGLGASIAAYAGPAASIAMAAFVAGMIAFGKHRTSRDELNQDRITPEGLSTLTGLTGDGNLQAVTNDASDALASIAGEFGNIKDASIDAKNGLVVFNDVAFNQENGLIEGIGYGVEVFDKAKNQWVRSTISFSDMIEKMRELAPATDAAAIALAKQVAEQEGLPALADELAVAYEAANAASDKLTPAFINLSGNLEVLRDYTKDLTDANAFHIATMDEATGSWDTNNGLFQKMLDEMQDLHPATSEAVQSTAEMVAAIYKVPDAVSYLVASFMSIANAMGGLTASNFTTAANITTSPADVPGEGGFNVPNTTWDDDNTEHGGMAKGGWMGLAQGGWISRNGSGWIHEGSGVKDDVFLGLANGGKAYVAGMGGEFVVNRTSASIFADELEKINNTYSRDPLTTMQQMVRYRNGYGDFPNFDPIPATSSEVDMDGKPPLDPAIAEHMNRYRNVNGDFPTVDTTGLNSNPSLLTAQQMVRYRNGYGDFPDFHPISSAGALADERFRNYKGDSISITVPVNIEDRSKQWSQGLKHEIERTVENYMRNSA